MNDRASFVGPRTCQVRAALAAVALTCATGCQHTTELTVRDAARVGVSVHDKSGELVDLPADGQPGEVTATLPHPTGFAFGGPVQRLTVTREVTGELHFDAPDTPGGEHGTLVTDRGVVVVPASYPGADDAARYGSDVRMRYLVWFEQPFHQRATRAPSFELWLHTPITNIVTAQVRTTPMRGFGVVLATLGGVFAVASLATLALSGSGARVGSAIVGGLAVACGVGGALVLALPETTRTLDLGER